MADTALQALAKLYQDEKRKLDEKGADFTEYNALAFTHGYPEADEDNAIDHSGYERHMADKGQQAREAAQARSMGPQAGGYHMGPQELVNRMQVEFQAQYGYLPTDEAAKQAARGFQGNVMTAEGRTAFYERIAALEQGEDTQVFGGARSGGYTGDPDDRPVGVEEANREWIGQLQAGRAKMGLR